MSPQPLNRVTRLKDGINISDNAVDERPTLSGMVMRVIATWSAIELEFFFLTASFLKTDYDIVTRMLLEITSGDGRRAAMRAAAEHSLSGDASAFAIFEKLDAAARSCRERRNAFAHGKWGYSDELPDALLLWDASDFAEYTMGVNAYHYRREVLLNAGKKADADKLTLPPIDHSKVMVYRESDLKTDVDRFEDLHRLVRNFHWMFHGDRMLRLSLHLDLLKALGMDPRQYPPPTASPVADLP